MTKRKVWRYKCDFCKKSGCSGPHIKAHESSCTFNPNRVCRLCVLVHGEPGRQRPLEDMIKDVGETEGAISWRPDDLEDGPSYVSEDRQKALVQRIRTAAGGCPACMLTVIKALTKNKGWIDGFDFKAESREAYQDGKREADEFP